MINRAVIVCLILSFIGCRNGTSGQSPGAIPKDQVKGTWQLAAIIRSDGKEYPVESVQSSKDFPETIQLAISDTQFEVIISDDRGLKMSISSKYKLEGQRLTTEKTETLKIPDYDVTIGIGSRLVLKNPKDKENTAQVYKKISETDLALGKVSHIKQELATVYSFTDSTQQNHKGELGGEAEFRSTSQGKLIGCMYSKSKQNSTDQLLVEFFEGQTEGKKSGASFSMSKIGFDFSLPEEKKQIVETQGTNISKISIFSLTDMAKDMTLSSAEDSQCVYEIARIGKSLKIKGACTSAMISGEKVSSTKITLEAHCELEKN